MTRRTPVPVPRRLSPWEPLPPLVPPGSRSTRGSRWGWSLVGLGLLWPLVAYGWAIHQRPPRQPVTQALFEGVTYQRLIRQVPRSQVIHVVTVDLLAPGLRVMMTPGDRPPSQPSLPVGDILGKNPGSLPQTLGDSPSPDRSSFPHRFFPARTTTTFAQEFQTQVAVNAGYFYPFEERTPWDYLPSAGDPVQVSGQSIANGQVDAMPRSRRNWPVLCFGLDATGSHPQGQILRQNTCPPGTTQATAGPFLVWPDRPTDLGKTPDRPYARTLAALDDRGTRLWLVVVDGKQPHYSEGATVAELWALLRELGAAVAVNLDGGGSTTLVVQGALGMGQGSGPLPPGNPPSNPSPPAKPQVVNAPIHGKWPRLERPVATHLGIYAQPLADPES
ncbi:phosphodiester glycosidase family protein [Prochlorothrix hollandica]|uniref:phosphodiester glycosidase family protein n=1 Tax=Prochlorothrix hollandica TaxID=1223 RepID=UPI0033404566